MRRGLTMIEMLIVIAIVAILIALTIPAVQYAREAARRTTCQSNLRQIALACQTYESQHRMFPPGQSPHTGGSPHVAILPFLERDDLYNQFQSHFVAADQNPVASKVIPLFVCPSDVAPDVINAGRGNIEKAGTSYAGNSGTWYLSHGFNGVFRYWDTVEGGPPIRSGEIADGLSNTSLFSEILRADGTENQRLRVDWNLDRQFGRDQLDAFADYCNALPDFPREHGWMGIPTMRGRPWTHGAATVTWYNHVLPPNCPACLNGSHFTTAAQTAASGHSNGVNVAFADAHIAFVSASIERGVWRAFGSRNGDAHIVSP